MYILNHSETHNVATAVADFMSWGVRHPLVNRHTSGSEHQYPPSYHHDHSEHKDTTPLEDSKYMQYTYMYMCIIMRVCIVQSSCGHLSVGDTVNTHSFLWLAVHSYHKDSPNRCSNSASERVTSVLCYKSNTLSRAVIQVAHYTCTMMSCQTHCSLLYTCTKSW